MCEQYIQAWTPGSLNAARVWGSVGRVPNMRVPFQGFIYGGIYRCMDICMRIYIYIKRYWFNKALVMRFKVLKSEESLLGDTTKEF